MSEAKTPRRPGRPARTTPPILVRGTVPDDHPLAPKLKELGPYRAALYLLDFAANHKLMEEFVASAQMQIAAAAAQSIAAHSATGHVAASLSDVAKAKPVMSAPLAFDADMADLLSFGGANV
ncbi:MAG: hypothetical protein ACRERX_23030 [Pseudomonas sp.]